jgi:hypothetical protein
MLYSWIAVSFDLGIATLNQHTPFWLRQSRQAVTLERQFRVYHGSVNGVIEGKARHMRAIGTTTVFSMAAVALPHHYAGKHIVVGEHGAWQSRRLLAANRRDSPKPRRLSPVQYNLHTKFSHLIPIPNSLYT